MIQVTVTVNGMPEALQYLDQLRRRLDDRDHALIRATNRVAEVWEKSFRGEGSAVGGWAPLAEKTLRMREYYGFPEGPILIRYGALKAVVVDRFMDVSVAGRWAMSDSYSEHLTEGQLELTSDGTAILSAHGWKIANQYGHSNPQGSDVPARPFWFTNRDVQEAAREGVVLWIRDEVI